MLAANGQAWMVDATCGDSLHSSVLKLRAATRRALDVHRLESRARESKMVVVQDGGSLGLLVV